MSTQRFAHMSYASFSNAHGGGGGWGIGRVTGDPTSEEKKLFQSHVPTVLRTLEPVDEFLPEDKILSLPRRFVYRPIDGCGLYIQAVPAGKDATGRPGNIFSHGVIDRHPAEPTLAQFPASAFRSPDFLTPFYAKDVNAAEFPADAADLHPGPHLDAPSAWYTVHHLLGNRAGVIYTLQEALEAEDVLPVLALENVNDAGFWLTALSSTMAPSLARQALQFSTFERAQTLVIEEWLSGPAVVCVPAVDADALKDPRLQVIRPAEVTEARPRTLWSRLTAEIFDPDADIAEVCRAIAAVDDADPRADYHAALTHLACQEGRITDPELQEEATAVLRGRWDALVETPERSADIYRDLSPNGEQAPTLFLTDLRAHTAQILRSTPLRAEVALSYLETLTRAGIIRPEECGSWDFVGGVHPETVRELDAYRTRAPFPAGLQKLGATIGQLGTIDAVARAFSDERRVGQWLSASDNSRLVFGVLDEGGRGMRMRDAKAILRSVLIIRAVDPTLPERESMGGHMNTVLQMGWVAAHHVGMDEVEARRFGASVAEEITRIRPEALHVLSSQRDQVALFRTEAGHAIAEGLFSKIPGEGHHD